MNVFGKVDLASRLVVLGMVVVLGSTGIGGVLLHWQLHRTVLRSVQGGIDERADRIAAGFLPGVDGQIVLDSRLVHDEFRSIFSGWYWQLEKGVQIERSRSLWDSSLNVQGAAALEGYPDLYQLTGPRQELLIGIQRRVVIEGQEYRLYVFGPGENTRAELARIDRILMMLLAGLSTVLLLGMILQVRVGLRPLRRLHAALSRIHEGDDNRVGKGYGPDLDPLAAEIDEVLERNARIVSRSRGYAADLSHALKKPLAILSADAVGTSADADTVRKQVGAMYQLIERHLSRAGSGAGDRRRINVNECMQGLMSLMQKLHANRQLQWQLIMPGEVFWRGEQTDLEEMLGNLLDNAGKWARSRVEVEVGWLEDPACARGGAAARGGGTLEILIGDDGTGLNEDEISRAKRRGLRFDESIEGSGLGLAIACDIAETYGGTIDLGRSGLGGLQITLRLPR
ncbi:MAG: HAMP domain-containing sensor histidine kinase [Lautropia sp.]|nr:HAMP domain-containing sensor histidine kinase [Lautropia sp.]